MYIVLQIKDATGPDFSQPGPRSVCGPIRDPSPAHQNQARASVTTFLVFSNFQKIGFGAKFYTGDSESTKFLLFFGRRNRLLWIWIKMLQIQRKLRNYLFNSLICGPGPGPRNSGACPSRFHHLRVSKLLLSEKQSLNFMLFYLSLSTKR